MVHSRNKTERLPSWEEDGNMVLDIDNYEWLVERALESPQMERDDNSDTKKRLESELKYLDKKKE
jgi:hypothetical protein